MTETTAADIIKLVDESIVAEYDKAVREYREVVGSLNKSYGGRIDFLRGLDNWVETEDAASTAIVSGLLFTTELRSRIDRVHELGGIIAKLIQEYGADAKSRAAVAAIYEEAFADKRGAFADEA